MAKTKNDEAYERGVNDGLDGNWLDDICNDVSHGVAKEISFTTPQDEIYQKGRAWGTEHRHDGDRWIKKKCGSSSTSSSSRSSSSSSESENAGCGCLVMLLIAGAIGFGIIKDLIGDKKVSVKRQPLQYQEQYTPQTRAEIQTWNEYEPRNNNRFNSRQNPFKIPERKGKVENPYRKFLYGDNPEPTKSYLRSAEERINSIERDMERKIKSMERNIERGIRSFRPIEPKFKYNYDPKSLKGLDVQPLPSTDPRFRYGYDKRTIPKDINPIPSTDPRFKYGYDAKSIPKKIRPHYNYDEKPISKEFKSKYGY